MVQQHEKVNYQGRDAWVVNIQGNEPHQIITIRFDDGSERLITLGELSEASGSGERGKPLNEKQIGRGQSSGGNIKPPNTGSYEDNKDYKSGMGTGPDTRADTTEPPLGEGGAEGGVPDSGNPPEWGIDVDGGNGDTKPEDQTPNDAGPGTGDTGAGLKADGKDVDSNRRRLLGTEEIVVYIEPVTRKVVDRYGRKIEIGTTVNLKARIVKFHGADKAEVLYPPYVLQSGIPVWSSERNRLEIPNQDEPTKGNGVAYEGMQFSYKDGQIVDANGNKVEQPKLEKQEKLTVKTKYIEKA